MAAILFNSLFPVTWVVITAAVMLCVLAWLEVKRDQKLLTLRLSALALAVFSVACLALKPALPVKRTSDSILLTPGYNTKTLDSLLTANPKLRVYKLPGMKAGANAIEITHYRELSKLNGNIFVAGEGLPRYMLDYTDTSALRYFPSPRPEGFTGIRAGNTFTAHQRGEITGMVHLNREKTITLTGPGAVEDSVHLAEDQQAFTLAFTPKAAGLFLYTLSATDSTGKTLYAEQVPVEVKEQKPLAVLFVSDYPSAETRFLKNFLEQRNHQLTLRYKISKEKYRTEFINTPAKNVGVLNEDLLQGFDLLITDASSLTSLTGAETRSLTEAVKNGLGLLTLINTAALAKQTGDLLDVKLTPIKSDSARLRVNNQPLKIPATPVSLSSPRNLFSIGKETDGRTVSGYYRHGSGRLGFQLLSHTFSYALAGEHEIYAGLWAPLINAVARKEIKKFDLRFTTPFPYYRDEPVEFSIIGGTEKPAVKTDGGEIPLVEDPVIKNIWYGKFWAGPHGWNAVHIARDSGRYNFYVSQPGEWNSLQVINQQQTMRKLSSHTNRAVETLIRQPISPVLFFILFLLSAGFLWLAPKL